MKLKWFIGVVFLLSASPIYAEKYFASDVIPVENQFIVVLKDDAPSLEARQAALKHLAAQHGTEHVSTYSVVLNGGVMRMSEAKAKALANHPSVSFVEQDSVIQLIVPYSVSTQTPTPSWGLDRIDQNYPPLNNIYNYSYDGTDVHAYVIDTGIRFTHSQFGGRAAYGFDVINDGQNGNDCNGHGTHVAGTIGGADYGVAKNVALIAVRVLDCSGSGTTSGVIAGVDWVTTKAAKPAVANMSLGGGKSTALDTAVNNSVNSGISYAIAAGNSNQNACNFSPARVASAVTVGATTSTDSRASYSNYGSCLDLFAPGSGITSAWNSSDTAINTISGTSMATPHVAGVIALILQYQSQNQLSTAPNKIAALLTQQSTANVVSNSGIKSPNLLLFSNP